MEDYSPARDGTFMIGLLHVELDRWRHIAVWGRSEDCESFKLQSSMSLRAQAPSVTTTWHILPAECWSSRETG